MQWQDVLASVFRVAGQHGNRRWGLHEPKALGCQAGQFAGPKPCVGRDGVKHCPIRPSQPGHGLAGPRCRDQRSELRLRQWPAVVPTIGRDIEHGDERQRIFGRTSIANQPATELLDGPKVVVASLDASSISSEIRQEFLNATGREVCEDTNPTGFNDSFSPVHDQLHLFFANTSRSQVLLKLFEMHIDGTLPMFVKAIDQSGCATLGLPDEFIQHRLCGGLVDCQGDTAFETVLILVSSPPFLGFCFDSLSGLWVCDDHRLLVQTGHSFFRCL